jgi:hypothetical protein
MDNKMYQDELEEFLQDEVKDHRMYPSDQIWRNIQNEVHGPQTWPALTFISLFIISALTVATLINNHPAEKIGKLVVLKNGNNKKPLPTNQPSVNSDFAAMSAEQVTATTIAQIEEQRIKDEAGRVITETPVIPMRFIKEEVANTTFSEKILTEKQLPSKPSFIYESNQKLNASDLINASESVDKSNLLVDAPESDHLTDQTKKEIGSVTVENNSIKKTSLDQIPNSQKLDASIPDEYLKEFAFIPTTTISAKNSKFGFGFFITPSTSYRKLSDFKAKELLGTAPATAPVGLNYTTNINEIVRHKPAVGLELGFAVLYNMTNRIKFKTGIQFNIRQYYIETFQSTADLTTISLVNNHGIENVSVLSLYNNNNGYRNAELDNKMYQVSIPIGFQYDVIKGKHLGITAEASIQPTFTLNKSLYLLSTDYKHYADGNSLMRKWNINSSLGINLTYKTGVYQWFLGPQARFQHLPTYSNKYPITEYLMDYGIRLGFIKQIK